MGYEEKGKFAGAVLHVNVWLQIEAVSPGDAKNGSVQLTGEREKGKERKEG